MPYEPFGQGGRHMRQHFNSVGAVAIAFAVGAAYFGYVGLRKVIISSPPSTGSQE